ncbi:MAG: redox-sensing transcriptional repressor Rex [Ruminococcus sp.]|nr:redox-sensing transcriptional repressor Rex [Ruminococcus sp.]
MSKNITSQTLQRLPVYLNYLMSLSGKHKTGNISATAIADALGLNDVQVRKDLATVSRGGRPRTGYVTAELINDIGHFLGFENHDGVIVAGVGNFGRAMMGSDSFSAYGFDVLCGFDCNENLTGTFINGKPIYHISEMKNFCTNKNIKIGIITVPEESAQEVCNIMAESGIKYILNFASVHLKVPNGITVHNENISITLAMLARCNFHENNS